MFVYKKESQLIINFIALVLVVVVTDGFLFITSYAILLLVLLLLMLLPLLSLMLLLLAFYDYFYVDWCCKRLWLNNFTYLVLVGFDYVCGQPLDREDLFLRLYESMYRDNGTWKFFHCYSLEAIMCTCVGICFFSSFLVFAISFYFVIMWLKANVGHSKSILMENIRKRTRICSAVLFCFVCCSRKN